MMMSIEVVSLTLCREPACGVQDRSISFCCLYSATRNRKLTSYDWTATRIVYMHSSKPLRARCSPTAVRCKDYLTEKDDDVFFQTHVVRSMHCTFGRQPCMYHALVRSEMQRQRVHRWVEMCKQQCRVRIRCCHSVDVSRSYCAQNI